MGGVCQVGIEGCSVRVAINRLRGPLMLLLLLLLLLLMLLLLLLLPTQSCISPIGQWRAIH